ncbi:MAG: ATP-binding protein, partial [Leptolyngbya sp.]|nr:ATP-binding protein [Leptolyngbya sp.]
HLPALYVDERRVRQVLINLLSNAVKFTPEGGRITLAVTPAPDPIGDRGALCLSVIDTGIGISPEDQDRLFQPFVQVDSALNRKYEGTGLGLVLTKRIVELHGGTVTLTSAVGEGSRFTITLPLARAARFCPAPAMADPSRPAAATPNPGQNPLILLVEDNQATIETIAAYLEVKGYRLMLAHNGHSALDVLQTHTPDLILMDIQMPEMDGFEAIQRVREMPHLREVPIIALTALAMTGDRDRCLAAGANEYLSKPVRLKQLNEHIQAWLHTPALA